MPRSGTVESYGRPMFSFLWNLHTVPHDSCTDLRSYQHSTTTLSSLIIQEF